jgi:primary-amine oxidase
MAGYYAPLKTDEFAPATAPAPRKMSKSRFLAMSVLGLLTGAAPILWGMTLPGGPLSSAPAPAALETPDALAQCPSNLPPRATPPAPANPWASLTMDESVGVYEWLWAPERGLNLSRADTAQLNDNVLYHVEAARPRKADALAYLDGGPAPARFARVTVNHGGAAEPYIMDYLVGPLPVGEETAMRPLTEIYHRDDIPFNARGFVNMAEISTLFLRLLQPLAAVTAVRVPSSSGARVLTCHARTSSTRR